MPTAIRYVIGDALCPPERPVIVAHICNDRGAWGAGFVIAVSRRWPKPEADYRDWCEVNENSLGAPFELGQIQFVEVEEGLFICNMIGQVLGGTRPPIRYAAVRKCLRQVGLHASAMQAAVAMPRIGCGLAGGSWERIEPIVIEEVCSQDVPVTVYDLPPRPMPAAARVARFEFGRLGEAEYQGGLFDEPGLFE